MTGENCTLSASGYPGAVKVAIERFSHGMEIIGTSDAARSRKAFYVSAVTTSNFSITILCGSDPTRFALLTLWLKGYGDRLGNPDGGVGPMRVQIPSRQFDRLAILKTGVRFGERVGAFSRRIALGFVGAVSPGDFANPMASNFVNSTDVEARYFYPGGQQLDASADPSDTLYGDWSSWGGSRWNGWTGTPNSGNTGSDF
jgi:hypothetical protein